MLNDNEIKAAILLKLFNRKIWGGKHTSFENLKRGIKTQELGKGGLKRVDGMAKDLIKEGWITAKPTHYGLEVSLNPIFSREIKEFLQKYFTG